MHRLYHYYFTQGFLCSFDLSNIINVHLFVLVFLLEIEAKILSIFLQFETQFDPYTTYCMEEANCLKYFKEKLIESEDFKTYITVRSLQAVMFHFSLFLPFISNKGFPLWISEKCSAIQVGES